MQHVTRYEPDDAIHQEHDRDHAVPAVSDMRASMREQHERLERYLRAMIAISLTAGFEWRPWSFSFPVPLFAWMY